MPGRYVANMAYWTKKNVVEFVKMYRDKDVLWDPENKSHFNKKTKSDAWNEIAAEFSRHVSNEVSANECKKKMSSLLAAYRRERLKIRKSHGTGSGKCLKIDKTTAVPTTIVFIY